MRTKKKSKKGKLLQFLKKSKVKYYHLRDSAQLLKNLIQLEGNLRGNHQVRIVIKEILINNHHLKIFKITKMMMVILS